MRVLVLGAGRQGRAVLYDLVQCSDVQTVTCADADPSAVRRHLETLGTDKVRTVRVDAANANALGELFRTGFDVVIDMLPRQFVGPVARCAVANKVHLVNAYYDHDLRDLADRAAEANVTLLPEMGMDPGIDLVMCGHAIRRFDKVTNLVSYGGGLPEPAAIDNPLSYKISWTWEGVLNSYVRDARVIENGVVVDVPGSEIFAPDRTHEIDLHGLGRLEAFPNGDAAGYAEKLGISATVRTCGRFALRWHGHCRFWHAIKQLGFLDEAPVAGLPGNVTPRQFMVKHLEPRLQYKVANATLVLFAWKLTG